MRRNASLLTVVWLVVATGCTEPPGGEAEGWSLFARRSPTGSPGGADVSEDLDGGRSPSIPPIRDATPAPRSDGGRDGETRDASDPEQSDVVSPNDASDTSAVDIRPPTPDARNEAPDTAGTCGRTGRTCECFESCERDVCRSALTGVWRGRYTCTQGVTGLELTVDGTNDTLQATFEFFPISENPGVPRGEFTMTGRLGCSGRFRFNREAWVDRPGPGWDMVALRGTFEPTSPDRLTGEVTEEPSCETFQLRRVGSSN